MPEQKRQRKGEDHRAVVAWEGVIRRVVQEGMTDILNERTFVREQLTNHPRQRKADGDGQCDFNHQMALRLNLTTFAPEPHSRSQQGNNQDQILSNKCGK